MVRGSGPGWLAFDVEICSDWFSNCFVWFCRFFQLWTYHEITSQVVQLWQEVVSDRLQELIDICLDLWDGTVCQFCHVVLTQEVFYHRWMERGQVWPSGGIVWSHFSLSMSQCSASCCHFWFTKRSIRGYFDVFLPSWWFGSTPGRMEMRNHDLIQSPAPCAGLDMLGFLFLSYTISCLKTIQRLSKMCFLALRTLMNLSKRPKQTQTMQIWDGTSTGITCKYLSQDSDVKAKHPWPWWHWIPCWRSWLWACNLETLEKTLKLIARKNMLKVQPVR